MGALRPCVLLVAEHQLGPVCWVEPGSGNGISREACGGDLLEHVLPGSVMPLPSEAGGVVYKATACVSNGSGTHPGMRVIHFWLHFQAFFKLSQLGRSVAAVSRFRIILSVIAF